MKLEPFKVATILAVIAAPQAALACHEVVVTMGKGLATQAYIAPNPANVLILYSDGTNDRQYTGLDLAGHRLTLVADVAALGDELARDEFDIVIAPLDAVDDVNRLVAAGRSIRVIPVVSRDMRRDRGVRDRFDQYLVDNAGVAKLLAVINRAMAG